MESKTRIENEDNLEYPLAFAISMHQHVGILEMFLMLMFRPMDSYCIHLDLKAEGKNLLGKKKQSYNSLF